MPLPKEKIFELIKTEVDLGNNVLDNMFRTEAIGDLRTAFREWTRVIYFSSRFSGFYNSLTRTEQIEFDSWATEDTKQKMRRLGEYGMLNRNPPGYERWGI